MNVDNIVKLFDTLTHFLGVIVWPGLIAVVIVRLGPRFGDFIGSLTEFSLKGGGIEASWKTEAAAALAAATVAPKEGGGPIAPDVRDPREAAEIVEGVTPQALRLAKRARILWVDDRPDNNIFERRALSALGVEFVISTSTDDALLKLKTQRFDVIISDMGRPPDPRAGYTLLDKLKAAGNQTPFIIYAGSRSLEHQAESRHHGAMGCTNHAGELFEMVLSALGGRRN